MRSLNVHGKTLPVPSFFQVFNFGGGCGDKSREIVYADITADTPALFNYFYINNEYPHSFQSEYFDDLSGFDTVGDIFNYVRSQLIAEKHNLYSEYPYRDYDFSEKVSLLDSGASNIVKQLAEECHYDVALFEEAIIVHMKKYYDFADRYKFDIVVGFDLGGKYTFKDGETTNRRLIDFYEALDKDAINKRILIETIKYLKEKETYYPYVLATVHGRTPEQYADYTRFILEQESTEDFSFWGFALGGIASAKSVDSSWYDDIDFSRADKRKSKDASVPARAINIVHSIVGDRPIHALGCGGYPNIAMNYYMGATSFDAASPARRVGDGNGLSSSYVFDANPPKRVNGKLVSFSKMFVGGYNNDLSLRDEEFDYIVLCDVSENFSLCGCNACSKVNNIHEIKELYSIKNENEEAFYFARQIMNGHAILQHRTLCCKVAQYHSMEDFCDNNRTTLNKKLLTVFIQLK